MTSDIDILNRLYLEYEVSLKDIIIFDLKYPDNFDGHNALVDVAKRLSYRLKNVGAIAVDPLPPYKN
jgi:hypothetical protein